MSDLLWLTNDQRKRLRTFFRKRHGRTRVDDRRMLSGIVFFIRNGLRWRDAPSAYDPHKTLEGLAAVDAEPSTVMIDATYLKAYRAASSLRVKKWISPV